MTYKVISLTDVRALTRTLPLHSADPGSAPAAALGGPVFDRLRRPLRDLRISVTDRCNFRCSYCMPKDAFPKTHAFLPQGALLSFEEIEQLASAFIALGVRKIRLTGGEPLLRRHIERLIERLAALRTPDGAPLDLTLTTNASVLAAKAQALRDAGLKRVTVSLDALDDAVFRRLNDVDFPVADVLAGIDAALRSGLGPIKVNMVVKRGVNDGQILPMARHFRGTGVALRFIEYMDVGATNGWRLDEVVPSAEIVATVAAAHALVRLPAAAIGETAERWQYRDGAGEIGVISSVTHAFCGDCNRARLSTEGKLYTCLFASQGHDLRSLLRGDADASKLSATLAAIWHDRADRYSELRGIGARPGDHVAPEADPGRRVEMHYIGG